MKPVTFRDYIKGHSRRLLFIRRPYGELYPRWQFWRGYKLDGFLPDLWYYAKCRFWKRYNTVTARDLHPTWQDPSELLLSISFAVLVFAVEQDGWFERTYKCEDYDGSEEWQEVATLYDWWVNVRPARIDPTDWWVDTLKAHGMYVSIFDDPNSEVIEHADGGCTIKQRDPLPFPEDEEYRRLILNLSHQMEKGYNEEDERMLKRLAEVRLILWT